MGQNRLSWENNKNRFKSSARISALPNNKIGQTQPLAALVAGQTDEDGTGVAGINGTFFMAYSDMQPTGTVIMNGEVLHASNAGSLIGIDGDNNVLVDAVYTHIAGGTMNQWEWPYNWYAWNINHWYPDPLATMLFDSHYAGPTPSHDCRITGGECDMGWSYQCHCCGHTCLSFLDKSR